MSTACQDTRETIRSGPSVSPHPSNNFFNTCIDLIRWRVRKMRMSNQGSIWSRRIQYCYDLKLGLGYNSGKDLSKSKEYD